MKNEKPKSRTVTPFLDAARNGDEHAELQLRIALAHGIVDVSQATNMDPEMLKAQVGKDRSLSPAQLRAAIAAIAGGEAQDLEELVTNERVSQWMPGGKKSRVAKNKD